jgi:hypothetical protein
MKFVCLGFADPSLFDRLTPAELSAAMEECFAYDDVLRRGGHFVGGAGLQPPQQAVTLRMQDGAVSATDGPYAETKEFLGGILFLEARDMDHAVALMSKHPGVRFGPWEIRPANEEIAAINAARDAAIGRSDPD